MSSTYTNKKRILCVVGTRPEAIKMAPVIRMLRESIWCDCKVISTGQHRDMARQTLGIFDVEIDFDMDLMSPNQRLSSLAGKILQEFDKHLIDLKPDLVIAQGDTTTVMAISAACFHARIPFAHVEAGLRTHDLYNPYPEEFNRKVAALTASLHFAPTKRAKENLLNESVPDKHVFVTGNTVIDALHWVLKQEHEQNPPRNMILVTTHRRENFGQPLENICSAIRSLHERYNDLEFIVPVHPNPNVKNVIHARIGNLDRVSLIEPAPYDVLASLIQQSIIVLTDSGGIQEEAPALAKPVLVLRTETERPEAIEAGVAKLIGTEKNTIVEEVARLLEDGEYYTAMATGASPYGDGVASKRIAFRCAQFLGVREEAVKDFLHESIK